MPALSDSPAPSPAPAGRPGVLVTVGKFFRLGTEGEKVSLRGISYGPFRPNSRRESFPEDAQIAADLAKIRQMGFDTVRLYTPPSEVLLTEAVKQGLKLIVGIAWTDHVDFMRSKAQQKVILEDVRFVVTRLRDHPAVIAFLIGNEIEKTLVRWMGPRKVQRFLERLIDAGRECAPNQLFSYATYPSTEYLIPRNADFLAMNVYLENRENFARYLQRLHHLAGNKPLVITEFGIDVANHGVAAQAETFAWFEDECQRAAVAGTVWFSYTDEWFRGGQDITEWRFGLVDAERSSRFAVHGSRLEDSQPRTENGEPRTGNRELISVIVCTYNGGATLRACLESLQKLRYPNYEVLVIDDGSTEDIDSIVRPFVAVRYVHQNHAGLSVARNLGRAKASGSILAYTDDDCIVDEDWLGYIAAGFDDPKWVACGGPNIPPAPRNSVEAVVAAAPGAPAHVMLNDNEAEHLPGCNLAIRKSALEAIGGFREHYRTAGDDVDICWRLREAGGHLRFMPGAMVWHHRRRTFKAYYGQQRGYGYAEAQLMKDHPEKFGLRGGARWRGAIYGDSTPAEDLAEGSIFHGPLGNGLFQGIYQHSRRCSLDWFSGVLWIPVWILTGLAGWKFVATALIVLTYAAALFYRLSLPKPPHPLSWKDELDLLGLCWHQPITREWARLRGMIKLRAFPSWHPTFKEVFEPPLTGKISLPLGEWAFWSEDGVGRESLLTAAEPFLPQKTVADGWQRLDIETRSGRSLTAGLLTVTEYHGGKKYLTRVRYLARVSLWAVLVNALLIPLVLIGPIIRGNMADLGLRLAVLGIMGLVAWNARHRVRKALQAAAGQCGLVRR
ncbi:MAG: glycosyltransferase [Verrucomicrobiota bacterium]